MKTLLTALSLVVCVAMAPGEMVGQDFGEGPGDVGPGTDQLMVDVIRAASASDRAAAAAELGRRRVLEAAPLLIAAVRTDPDAAVRFAALHALEGLREQQGVEETLRAVSKDSADEAMRLEATRILSLMEEARAERAAPWSRYRRLDPDQARAIYSHTAFPTPSGTLVGKSYNIGHWNFKYAINRNVELGGHVSVPVFFIHLGPIVKFQGQVNDWFHVGGFAQVHAAFSYMGDGAAYFAYGGGPILTFGNPDLSLSVSAFIHGHHLDGDTEESWSVVPMLSGAARVHRMVKLVAELWIPVVGTADEIVPLSGELAILMYGIRLFSDQIFGDISFLWPIREGVWDFMQYMPMGIPLLNFGFAI